jgi:hypothetical protein
MKWFDRMMRPVPPDLEFRIARLDLRDGDILVLKVPGYIPRSHHDSVRDQVMKATNGHKVLVLDGGADLAVLTAAEKITT